MTMKPGAALVHEDLGPYTYRHRIEREANGMRALVLVDPAVQRWAVIGHQVAGWRCLATGAAGKGWSAEAVAEDIARRYGDGFDHIARGYYRLTRPGSEIIHQLRSLAPGESAAYCGVPAANPYVYKRGGYFQHCVKCTDTYRAEHYGRCPVEEF
jgi:hypothetical protein